MAALRELVSVGFTLRRAVVSGIWQNLAQDHALFNTELSDPEIKMKLLLLKVSGDTEGLGYKEQQKRKL